MDLAEALEAMIVTEHARKVKEYCNKKKNCRACIFFCGTCGLGGFLPSDWDFRIKEAKDCDRESD